MAAHVADQHRIGALIELRGEILHVDAEIAAHLHQDGAAIGMDDRRGHGCEGEGGDENARAPRQIEGLQREEQGIRAGGNGEREAAAHHCGEFRFEQAHRAVGRSRVAEQIARLQQPLDLGAGGCGDRLGRVYIRGGLRMGRGVRARHVRFSRKLFSGKL